MTIRIAAFARIREIVGHAESQRAVPGAPTAGDVWRSLAAEFPALEELRASTRMLRNGTLVDAAAALADGDELALLPPFGGG